MHFDLLFEHFTLAVIQASQPSHLSGDTTISPYRKFLMFVEVEVSEASFYSPPWRLFTHFQQDRVRIQKQRIGWSERNSRWVSYSHAPPLIMLLSSPPPTTPYTLPLVETTGLHALL